MKHPTKRVMFDQPFRRWASKYNERRRTMVPMKAQNGRPVLSSLFITFVCFFIILKYTNFSVLVQVFFKLFSVVDFPRRFYFLDHLPTDDLPDVTTVKTVEYIFLFHILINNRVTGRKVFPKILNCLDGSFEVNLEELPRMTLDRVPTELLQVSMNQVFNLVIV